MRNQQRSHDAQPSESQKGNDNFITGFHDRWIEWFESGFVDPLS